jgi:DNA-binding response OmpR family regulator
MSSKPFALLLEDELLIAVDVEMALNQAGFSVVTFSKCSGAEKWLRRHSPRVAVIDVSLLDGSCETAASTLLERNIPVLVHTARRQQAGDVAPVFSAGMWLEKPADVEQIAALATKLSGLVTT